MNGEGESRIDTDNSNDGNCNDGNSNDGNSNDDNNNERNHAYSFLNDEAEGFVPGG
jgi:hypothetical protein